MFLIMFMYMILFSSMQDLATAKMEVMPKEILQFMGVEGLNDMANYINYFGMINNFILIAVSIIVSSFAAKLITDEESVGTMEVLAGLAVSRREIYFSKLLVALTAVFCLVTTPIIAAMVCGFIGGGDTFILSDFIIVAKTTSVIPFIFVFLALSLAAIIGRSFAVQISNFLVVASYMVGYLGKLLEDKGNWLRNFSPFEILNVRSALNGDYIYTMSAYLIFIVIAIYISLKIYEKRDFKLS